MGRKRVIDVHGLLFDDELVETLGLEGLFVYQIIWSIAEDWGGYEPKYGSIALESGALRLSKGAVEQAINSLIRLGKIVPYEANGNLYHWIRSFLKHQNLNNPPPPSIPTPPWVTWEECRYGSGKRYAKFLINQEKLEEYCREITGSLPVDYQDTTGSPRNETKRNSSTTLAGGSRRTASADPCPSAGVCVDSGPPDEDKTPDDTHIKAAGGFEAEQTDSDSAPEVPDGGNGNGAKRHLTPNILAELWNDVADPVFPRVILPLSEKRQRKLRPAIRARPDPGWWRRLFSAIGNVAFLTGENDRGWRATLDFVASRWDEVVEGKYGAVEARSRADPHCPVCGGDGTKFVEENGEQWARPCQCLTTTERDRTDDKPTKRR
jgi:predicted nucleic acid-binding Zn ribbon protein